MSEYPAPGAGNEANAWLIVLGVLEEEAPFYTDAFRRRLTARLIACLAEVDLITPEPE